MRFLKGVDPEVNNVMLLNILYFNERNYAEDDVLSIVYKDMDTGEKYIENIVRPEIDVYIVKEECRQLVQNTVRDWYPKDWMEIHRVRYRDRYRQIARILDLEDADLAKVSPYVAWSNMDIRSYYCIQFELEYGNNHTKHLNVGFMDIENDTIEIDHFPLPGETPINAVTYVDEPSLTVYTLLLRTSGPSFYKDPHTGKPYDNRDQIDNLEAHLDEFKVELNDLFEPSYGKLDYNILFFNDEKKLIQTLFRIIEACKCDFCEVWNLPYDMSNLVTRPERLLVDPIDLVCGSGFAIKEAIFQEDTNPVVHKRKHKVQISHPTVFIDQMVLYAGIRSAQGKIPSLKLNAIARKVIGDEKIDYSEEGNIRTLAYVDYKKFVIYNIKDVLLQLGIHRITNDIDDAYTRMYRNCELINEVFTTTTMLTNSIYVEFYKMGFIAGNNRNKMKTDLVNRLNAQAIEDAEFADIEDPDLVAVDRSDDEEEEEEENKPKKKKKVDFEGAMVMNPNRMKSSGVIINGIENDKVHEYVIDEDATSLYPTTMIILNLSNETMIGRIEFVDDKYDFFHKLGQIVDIDPQSGKAVLTAEQLARYKSERLPMYGYSFLDKEDEDSYTINISDDFTMKITEEAVEEIGTDYVNLPGFDELLKMYGEL